MIRTDIGEIVISVNKKGALSSKKIDYVFTPSFENLSKLGEPNEIVNAYAVLLSNEAYEILNRFKEPNKHVFQIVNEKLSHQIEVAKKVLCICCNDDISLLIGVKNKKGLIPNSNILMIARTLLDYGISGKAKVRVSQRNQTKNYVSEFKVSDYISNARVHLGLSLDEAKQLTMTEYILLMANKFPDNDGFTREEYDNVLAAYEKRRKERLSRAAK